MKNRLSNISTFIIIITTLSIISSLTANASGFNSSSNIKESTEGFYVGENWYPMWVYYPQYENRMYAYVVMDEYKDILNNIDGYEYISSNNNVQVIMVPYNNNDDPWNLEPLKDESQYYKMFEIPENRFYTTDTTKYKVRWETSMGFKYQTTLTGKYVPANLQGKKNQNFKTEGSDIQTKLPIVNGGVRPFIYQSKQGVPQMIVDYVEKGISSHFIFYNADLINLLTGLKVDNRNLKKEPDKSMSSVIKVGSVELDYRNNLISDEEAQIIYLDFYKYYPGMRGNLERKGAVKGDPTKDPAARISQTKYFFMYANVQEAPSKYVNGRAQIAYSSGYATLTTPAYSPINNLKFYDMTLIDADTNQKISSELIDYTDEHKVTKKIKSYDIPSTVNNIKIKWQYGYVDSRNMTLDVTSRNTQHTTNLYLYDNKMNELGTEQSILGDKLDTLKGFYAIDIEFYLKKAAELNTGDYGWISKQYPEIEKLALDQLDTFEVTIPVSKLQNEGFLMSALPWQLKSYTENMDYKGRTIYEDNSIILDDTGLVKYNLNETPTTDLKIIKVEGFGTFDETSKKYEVESGKTYDVKVTVNNIGQADTTRINPKVSWATNTFSSITLDETRNSPKGSPDPIIPKILKSDSTDILKYNIKVTVPKNAKIDSSFNLGVAIAKVEDDFDNIFNLSDDFVALDGIVKSKTDIENADIGIKDIVLKAGGTTYNSKVAEPNFYGIDPSVMSYTMEITIQKYAGTAPVTNPRIILSTKAINSDDEYNTGGVTFSGTLSNIGDTLKVTRNITTTAQYLEIKAEIDNVYHLSTTPITNIENENDSIEKKYVAGYDFQVADVIVSPNKGYATENGYFTSPVSVTAKINTAAYVKGNFNNVQVILRMKTPSGVTSNLQTKEVDLVDGMESVIFDIPSNNYTKGFYGFEVEVNANRAHYESDYTNNIGSGVLEVSSPCSITYPSYCFGGTSWTRNDWKMYHYIIERQKYWYTCCSKYGGCHPCCLGGSLIYNGQPYPKSYYETFNLTAYSRSKKTDWNWTTGDIEVNAGRAFEIKWDLKYYTNRKDVPRTQNRMSNGTCGYDNTNPTYSNYYFTTPLYVDISGYSFPNLSSCSGADVILYPISTAGNWDNRTYHYEFPTKTDALGDVTKKLYTEINTSNRLIVFRAWTNKISGYPLTFGERTGSNKALIDCITTTIKVKDAIDVEGKTIKD